MQTSEDRITSKINRKILTPRALCEINNQIVFIYGKQWKKWLRNDYHCSINNHFYANDWLKTQNINPNPFLLLLLLTDEFWFNQIANSILCILNFFLWNRTVRPQTLTNLIFKIFLTYSYHFRFTFDPTVNFEGI